MGTTPPDLWLSCNDPCGDWGFSFEGKHLEAESASGDCIAEWTSFGSNAETAHGPRFPEILLEPASRATGASEGPPPGCGIPQCAPAAFLSDGAERTQQGAPLVLAPFEGDVTHHQELASNQQTDVSHANGLLIPDFLPSWGTATFSSGGAAASASPSMLPFGMHSHYNEHPGLSRTYPVPSYRMADAAEGSHGMFAGHLCEQIRDVTAMPAEGDGGGLPPTSMNSNRSSPQSLSLPILHSRMSSPTLSDSDQIIPPGPPQLVYRKNAASAMYSTPSPSRCRSGGRKTTFVRQGIRVLAAGHQLEAGKGNEDPSATSTVDETTSVDDRRMAIEALCNGPPLAFVMSDEESGAWDGGGIKGELMLLSRFKELTKEGKLKVVYVSGVLSQ